MAQQASVHWSASLNESYAFKARISSTRPPITDPQAKTIRPAL